MEKLHVNTCCPYCGSKEMTTEINIRITGDLQHNGTIKIRDYWTPAEELEIAVSSAPSKDIKGYCSHCSNYCDFDWKKGFIEE